MQTLEMALGELYRNKVISFEEAMSKTSRPEELQRLIGGSPSAAQATAKAGAKR